MRPVLSIFQRVVSCGSVLGLLALGACASAPDVAPKSAAQQLPAIKPATDKPTSTLSGAPGAANGGVLGPGQLIPGLAQNNLPPIEIMPSRPSPDANGLVRVGLLVPLSGASAPVGTALLNAAQMALFDVADDRFVLQAYDTKGTPEGAAAASNMALSHGVQLILGPLFSAEAKAIAPQANAAGVNVVTFSTDPAIAGPRVFVMGFLVQEQVRQIINYARNEGHKRFAVLAPDSAYGQSVVEAFEQMVPARGGEVAHVAFYQADGKNLSDVVKRLAAYDERQQALALQKAELANKQDEISQLALKRLETLDTIGEVDFDAILLPDQGARLTQAASLLPFYDIDPGRVQLFGTLLWNTPGLGRESALVGGIYPAPPADSSGQFFARYRELYGQGAPSIATHGYDAVALAAVLARSVPTNAFTAEGITAATGFAGIDGIFRFLPSGLSQRGFAIMQVTREGAIALQPGPATFETNAQF